MDRGQNTQELEAAGAELVAWLGTLRLAMPRRSGSLAVVPVYGGERPTSAAYCTLVAALAAGEASITELASASVPTLRVLNYGARPVLILDGEEVVGGWQNRVVNTTLLVPPKTAFDLPVSCIEHGRWHEMRATFEPGEAVHPSLRRQKAEQVTASFHVAAQPQADQGAVWAEVAARHRRTGRAQQRRPCAMRTSNARRTWPKPSERWATRTMIPPASWLW